MRPENTGAALAAVAPIAAKGDAIRLDTDIGSILGYIVVGLIVGLLARLLVPGRNSIDSSEPSSSVSSAPSWVAGSPAPSSGRRKVWTGSPRSALPCC